MAGLEGTCLVTKRRSRLAKGIDDLIVVLSFSKLGGCC